MIKRIAMLLGCAALFQLGAIAQDTSTPPQENAVVASSASTAQPAPAASNTESPAATTSVAASPQMAEQPDSKDDTARLAIWEMIVFCIVVIGVIALGIWKSKDPNETAEEKKEKGAADYFLAGRGLSWWLVGFSLIAANISTEQFVGMSGKASNWVGLAIAGYEWLAAITLVVVAFTFLPMLLKRGVFTIPQFLEERYDGKARSIMALANLAILVGVPTAGVIFAGAKVVSVYFGLDMSTSCIIIAASATVYVFVGGLKACAWTDLIWGAALIVGGGVVLMFAMEAMSAADPKHLMETASTTSKVTVESLADSSAMERFFALNGGEALTATNTVGGKLSMVRPDTDPEIPWTALCLGLWIPNFFYWGLNQYIMQRTLASKSLAEGQKGIVFAAALKLLIPFVVIIPGILAYNLYQDDMKASADSKNADAITAVTKSAEEDNKTPLYDITPDYIMANTAIAVDQLIHNANSAGSADQKKAMATHMDSLRTVSELHLENDAEVIITGLLEDYKTDHKVEIYIPESADSVEKKQRILSSALAFEIASVNGAIIKDNSTGDGASKFAVSSALNGYDYDSAFALLLSKLLPNTGWAWFVLAALFGAVVSSLASMLNSASTLLTMDIYNKIRKEQSSQSELVFVGKTGVLICAAIALVLAIYLNSSFDSIFTYIQEFQGFLSPGALVVFLFGFFVPKCPRYFGWLGIAINVVEYGLIMHYMPEMPFLNRMAVCLITIVLIGYIITIINSKRGGKAIVLADKGIVEMESSKSAKVAGIFVVIATIALYAAFWG